MLQVSTIPSIVTTSDTYSCKSILQSILKKIEDEYYKLIVPQADICDFAPAVDEDVKVLKSLLQETDTIQFKK